MSFPLHVGEFKPTLEEARDFAFREAGVFPEVIPGWSEVPPPLTGESRLLVAQCVVEFIQTGKTVADVKAESFIHHLGGGKKATSSLGPAPTTNWTQ